MNREQKERLHYIVPRCTVIPMQNDNLLQAASGNAGTIGYGGSGGDAKRNTSVEEWEDEETSPTSSKEGESSYPSYNAWEE